MNRFGAFLIHLAISLAIFAVLAYLVLYVWYPDFFFDTDGGWQGMRIIVFVDLVLGPLLTLIVFNRSKPARELKRDLGIIATVQLSCLAAGVYVVYEARPLALVYVDGTFYSMTESAYEELGIPTPDLGQFPGPWPKRVVVDIPEDYEEQSRIRKDAYRRGFPLKGLVQRYVPMSYERLDPNQEGYDAGQLRRTMAKPHYLAEWLAEQEQAPEDFVFFRYVTRIGHSLLAVSKNTQRIAGAVIPPVPPPARSASGPA